MSAGIALRSFIAEASQAIGMTARRLRTHGRDGAAILMYHRILPRDKVGKSVQSGMYVEPVTLRAHIHYLRKHFEIVPLAALVGEKSLESRKTTDKPYCALTFDDGWLDFHEYAYPILLETRAPATVFLPTDYIGTDRWFWTDELGHIVEYMCEAGINVDPAAVTSSPTHVKLLAIKGAIGDRLEGMIPILKALAPADIQNVLEGLREAVGAPAAKPCRAFINWAEVREMHHSGLITFGSHTASHPLLTQIPMESANAEMLESKVVLAAQLGDSHREMGFCYPNGSYSSEHALMASDAGYRYAVTTRRGWHTFGDNPYTINRIGIHQDMTATSAMFGARVAGIV